MGALKQTGHSEEHALRSRCLIGRAPRCDVRLEDPRISAEHALVSWTGSAWELRDLDSRNHTYVQERALTARERITLSAGDAFTLGGPTTPATELCLADASPPLASARHVTSGVVREASHGLLVLPDDDDPLASVVEARDGRWMLELGGEARMAQDGEIVTVGDGAWSLDLPIVIGPTISVVGVPGTAVVLDEVTLRFHVSRDEERVEITVVHPRAQIHMPARSHHYLLLTLARARMADAEASVPPETAGFREKVDLCRMLATDEYRLNVDVCRVRKQLAAAGVVGAASIVERRAGTGRLRLGVSRIEIERDAV